MKKIYVQPVASNVAFVVNENIATSGIIFEGTSGSANFWATIDGCNDKFVGTDIETNLEDGDMSMLKAMESLSKEELQIIMDMLLTGKLSMSYN